MTSEQRPEKMREGITWETEEYAFQVEPIEHSKSLIRRVPGVLEVEPAEAQ